MEMRGANEFLRRVLFLSSEFLGDPRRCWSDEKLDRDKGKGKRVFSVSW
jgi:hypothetical protein